MHACMQMRLFLCLSSRTCKGFKVFQSSRICFNLRNKSALVIGICTTFIYFQTLRPRKRGFLHKTGFSLPHRYHFDDRSSSESEEPRFRLLESEANAVIYIHPKFFNWAWHLTQVTHAGHVRDRDYSAAKPGGFAAMRGTLVKMNMRLKNVQWKIPHFFDTKKISFHYVPIWWRHYLKYLVTTRTITRVPILLEVTVSLLCSELATFSSFFFPEF